MAEKSTIAQKIDALKATIGNQQNEIARLNGVVAQLNRQLDEDRAKRVELEMQYKRLLQASGMVALQKGDVTKAKKQIALMIDEIDRCIQQLSE